MADSIRVRSESDQASKSGSVKVSMVEEVSEKKMARHAPHISHLFQPPDPDKSWNLTNMFTSRKPFRLSQFSFEDEDDEDDKVKEAVSGVFHWFRRRVATVGIVVLSLIVTFVIFAVDPNNEIRPTSAVGLWMWTALPGMVVMVYLLCGIIENTILWIARKSFSNPTWILVIILQQLTTYLRLIMFTVALDVYLIDWFNTYSGNPERLNRVEVFARNCLRSVYIVALLIVLRNILLNLLECSFTLRSFQKQIYDIYRKVDTLQQLFCRSAHERQELYTMWKNDSDRKQFMYRVRAVRDHPLRLNLEQSGTNESEMTIVFSTIDLVEIQTAKDMSQIAGLLFDQLMDMREDDKQVIDFSQWRTFFEDVKAAKGAFVSVFSSNPVVMMNRSATREQFVNCWSKIVKQRTGLVNRLLAARNVFNLVQNIAKSVFWILMTFVIATNFGFDIAQVVTAASAFVISFAFATSKSLSRIVESVMFVFASHPYQVNDIVKIGGRWWIIESIGILETKVRDPSNLVTRFSNQLLADMEISNVVYSRQAISIMIITISVDTTVDKIEQLRSALLRYTLMNSNNWKSGRVTMFQNGITESNNIELEIRVESHIEWMERAAFRAADFALKTYFREQLALLGMQWQNPIQRVQLINGSIPAGTMAQASDISTSTTFTKSKEI